MHWFQVLDKNFAELVFAELVNSLHVLSEAELLSFALNHFRGQIVMLKNPVVANHDWHNDHILSM